MNASKVMPPKNIVFLVNFDPYRIVELAKIKNVSFSLYEACGELPLDGVSSHLMRTIRNINPKYICLGCLNFDPARKIL